MPLPGDAMYNYEGLLDIMPKISEERRWTLPFPMGVFGTLRQGWCNNHLMGSRDKRGSYTYEAHYKAFLPHFVPQGLRLIFQPNAAGVFEVFTYNTPNWRKMIPNVDRLEGFTPPKGYFYHRTLVWLSILPANFEHMLFDKSISSKYRDERDLKIPKSEWMQYPQLPCWVYSSIEENSRALKSTNPIIWDGHLQKEPVKRG